MPSILIVEDDTLMRENMGNMLALEGHAVGLASNGPTGIESHREKKFDLIIMDVFMPEVKGLETIGILRQAGDKVRILAIGMMNDWGSRLVRAKELGADAALKKPFKMPEFLAAVNELLGPAAQQPEVPSQHRGGTG